jgi:hypothetical protein
MNLRSVVVALFAAIALVGVTAGPAYADFCVRNDNSIFPVSYQFQIGTANNAGVGTPIVVTGERVFALLHKHQLFGMMRVLPSGAIQIAFQSIFNFAFGAYAHPVETSVFSFPVSGTPTYDTTYHGNGAPQASAGNLTVIACPISAAEPPAGAVDPNAAK